MSKMFRSVSALVVVFTLTSLSQGKTDNTVALISFTTPKATSSNQVTITTNPVSVKQEMIGFGGALIWSSNRATGQLQNEIADLMFTDSGIDIIRFKNWYYLDNFPADNYNYNVVLTS